MTRHNECIDDVIPTISWRGPEEPNNTRPAVPAEPQPPTADATVSELWVWALGMLSAPALVSDISSVMFGVWAYQLTAPQTHSFSFFLLILTHTETPLQPLTPSPGERHEPKSVQNEPVVHCTQDLHFKSILVFCAFTCRPHHIFNDAPCTNWDLFHTRSKLELNNSDSVQMCVHSFCSLSGFCSLSPFHRFYSWKISLFK